MIQLVARSLEIPLDELSEAKRDLLASWLDARGRVTDSWCECFQYPAFDHQGHPALVITLFDTKDRLDPEWQVAAARTAREAAASITSELGGEVQRSLLAAA